MVCVESDLKLTRRSSSDERKRDNYSIGTDGISEDLRYFVKLKVVRKKLSHILPL